MEANEVSLMKTESNLVRSVHLQHILHPKHEQRASKLGNQYCQVPLPVPKQQKHI